MTVVPDEDWTLVARNSDDFRPLPSFTSKALSYLGQPLHAGLICLNLPAGSGRAKRGASFEEAAFEQFGIPAVLVNKVLEIDLGLQTKRMSSHGSTTSLNIWTDRIAPVDPGYAVFRVRRN